MHPFDDPVVIAGAGTVGLEILEDVPGVDTIVVACGGGGLVSGIAAACVPAGVRVVAVEPERSNALALGLAAGEPVPVTPETIADALTAPFTGRRPDRDLRSARGRGRPRLRGRDPGGIPLPLQPGEARRRAGRRDRRRQRSWPGRWRATTSVSVVSGGNVSADIASAILAATMKADIHPEYVLAHVTCSCGNEFTTRSTKPELHVEVCSHCHPFYTGKQKLMDAGGRVERFQRRLEKAGGPRRG